jgi:2-dehydro-3-deoxy-D-arabinonate dehydratase
MRYVTTDGGLVVIDGARAYDLSDVEGAPDSFGDLAVAADGADLDAVADRHLPDAPTVDPEDALDRARVPVPAEEVWAAGVTYQISEEARESESSMPDVYLDVYSADRPELFFKATPSRTVGPGEAVGIRGDSDWDVPEPELGVVLHEGDVVGYTIGNDVSSRSIEGENPLYLPQAKVYDRCCALGPAVASAASVGDPHDLEMAVEIERDGDVVYEGQTSTAEMARTCEELVAYLTRHNTVPEHCVLLTGTSLVPPDEFTLRVGDEVHVDLESIGRLSNGVVEV